MHDELEISFPEQEKTIELHEISTYAQALYCPQMLFLGFKNIIRTHGINDKIRPKVQDFNPACIPGNMKNNHKITQVRRFNS